MRSYNFWIAFTAYDPQFAPRAVDKIRIVDAVSIDAKTKREAHATARDYMDRKREDYREAHGEGDVQLVFTDLNDRLYI